MTMLEAPASAVTADSQAEPSPQPDANVVEYDTVDASGDASFPASDPPSWWGGS
jgi:hypothetical protein